MPRICVELLTPDKVVEQAKRLRTPEKAYYFVRDKIKYEEDPFDVWKDAYTTLKEGSGDCDDRAILLASLLIAMGYDAWVRIGNVTAFEYAKHIRKGTFDHAWVMLRNGTDWIQLDPSCINCKYGQTAFIVNHLIMDFNNKIIYVYNPEKAKKYIIK